MPDILASGTRLPETQAIDVHARPVSARRYPSAADLDAEYEPTTLEPAEALLESD
jgi:hypothetical protein